PAFLVKNVTGIGLEIQGGLAAWYMFNQDSGCFAAFCNSDNSGNSDGLVMGCAGTGNAIDLQNSSGTKGSGAIHGTVDTATSVTNRVTANTDQIGGHAVSLDANNLLKVDVEDYGGNAGHFTSGRPDVTLSAVNVTGNVAADLQTIKT